MGVRASGGGVGAPHGGSAGRLLVGKWLSTRGERVAGSLASIGGGSGGAHGGARHSLARGGRAGKCPGGVCPLQISAKSKRGARALVGGSSRVRPRHRQPGA